MKVARIFLSVTLTLALAIAACAKGPTGATGATGKPGAAGSPGAPGSPAPAASPAPSLTFGHFYALMPGDNSATVAAGTAVDFPQNGAASGITRSSSSQFLLPASGVYEVSWQVSITEPGQLVLGLDTGAGVVEQAYTVAGRSTGTSQISNDVLVINSAANSVLSIRNPTGNSTALTVTPSAGGTQAVSASLLIKQLQ